MSSKEKKDIKRVTSRSPNDLRMRWQTREGIEQLDKIKKYIDVNKNSAELNFEVFGYPGTSSIYDNKGDLGGIDLTSVGGFENKRIVNANFESAIFNENSWDKITLSNVSLDNANFENAFLRNLTFQDKVTLGSANLSGAEIYNWSGLSDKNLNSPLVFTTPWYWNLLLKSILLMFRRDYAFRKYTSFKMVEHSNLEESSNREFYEYVKWYQHIMYKFEKYRKPKLRDLPKKTFFILSMIFTKFWTSFSVLILWATIFNLLAAWVISSHPSSFHYNNTPDLLLKHPEYASLDFGTALHYCIVTFTTLGYGELYPLTHRAQIAAGTVVIVGYFSLAAAIYLMSRRVEKMF